MEASISGSPLLLAPTPGSRIGSVNPNAEAAISKHVRVVARIRPMPACTMQCVATQDATHFDPPLANASFAPLARVTRRLAVISVQPGAGTLQAALNAASDGDELVLYNGTYTGSDTNVLEISKSITIRSLHPRGAILDGENARRVVSITNGTVVLEGIDVTRGHTVTDVSAARFIRPDDVCLLYRRSIAPMKCLMLTFADRLSVAQSVSAARHPNAIRPASTPQWI